MKRLLLPAVIVILLLILTACSKEAVPTETAVPEELTEEPTAAPYIDTRLDEPEWTLPEVELKLEDKDNIYAEGADIRCFAIITNDDGSRELWFLLNDETATMLKSQDPDNDYYMTMDGDKIGSAEFSDDFTTVIVTSENAEDDITTLASEIRGLSE